MPDPRFFPSRGPFTLAELVRISAAEPAGESPPGKVFRDVAPLHSATSDEVSFLDNVAYVDAFAASEAGACIVHPKFAAHAPVGMALLTTESPYLAYARVATAFHPVERPAERFAEGHAHVDESAKVGSGTAIAPGAVVGPRAEIGAGCTIGANSVIGEGVVIGDDCHIGANVSVKCSLIGNRVVLYAGVRVGEPGFGFAVGEAGAVNVPQIGRVIIEDDVEIGANSTVDRGSGPDTVIGAGTRIDNLVQIGHNVRIGRGCILVAQCGIAGSSVLGDGVQVGGQTGIAGHLTIGDGARVAGKSGVMKDVPAGGTVGGVPAVPMQQWLRQAAVLGRLAGKKDV